MALTVTCALPVINARSMYEGKADPRGVVRPSGKFSLRYKFTRAGIIRLGMLPEQVRNFKYGESLILPATAVDYENFVIPNVPPAQVDLCKQVLKTFIGIPLLLSPKIGVVFSDHCTSVDTVLGDPEIDNFPNITEGMRGRAYWWCYHNRPWLVSLFRNLDGEPSVAGLVLSTTVNATHIAIKWTVPLSGAMSVFEDSFKSLIQQMRDVGLTAFYVKSITNLLVGVRLLIDADCFTLRQVDDPYTLFGDAQSLLSGIWNYFNLVAGFPPGLLIPAYPGSSEIESLLQEEPLFPDRLEV